MVDVLVIGGGPTGLAAALAARARGLSAVVVDPHDGPADKACGEGLMPAGVAALAALGVEVPRARPFEGIRYVRDGQHADGRFADGPGLGIRRTVLHAAMRARVDAVGVPVVQGRVSDLVLSEERVVGAGVEARYALVCDGLHSPTRRALGLTRPGRWPRRYGLRRHYAVAPWSDFVEVHWADDAEAYVTPVDDGLVGVAILYGDAARTAAGDGAPFERLLARFPALVERLGVPVTAARGAGPFSVGAAARVHGRALLVGDAAGYLDPLTGEGIKLGVLGAVAAVDALAAGRPEAWEAAWRRLYRPYALATGGLLLATRPRWARRWLVPVLRAAPGLMTRVIGVIGG